MSSSLSGLSPIATYLSISKNEQADVAQYVKSTPTVQRTVSAFQSDSVTIASPADLLLSKNQAALNVVLGAYNMSGESTETGLLRQLLTQDPTVSNSLVKSLGSTDDLDFVKAMTGRSTVAMNFGDPTALGFTAGGVTASQVSFSNLAWSSPNSALTAAAPGESWSYVLNDGTGAASIAAALTTAVQSTGTTADPVTTSYSVNAAGAIVGSDGAPAITTTTDSAGNTVYSIALASSSTAAPIRLANVVGVNVPASSTTPTTLTTSAGQALLSKAFTATGFNVVTNPQGGLNILNPINNGTLSLSSQSYSSFAAVTPKAISSGQTVLQLGSAGIGLSAGQVLLSGGNAIGTVKSVDAIGNVTLTAATSAATDIDAGARIDVAIGAGVSNVGIQISAGSAIGAGNTTMALGSAAAGLKAGQVITDGKNVVGIVKSVTSSGTVALKAATTVAVASGDKLGVLPQITDQTTAALADATNTKTILSQYETSQYETQEDQQVPGMADALYFTRTMPSITSINQLMSDPRLLNVVTTNLGISDTYGNLPFDQQEAVLTKAFNLSTMKTPASLQHQSEQFLALTGEQNASNGSGSEDPAIAILSAGLNSADGESGDGGAGLFAALYPSSSSNSSGLTGILGALYA